MCNNGRMDWEAVPGYEGYYEAHEGLYAVRSLDRVVTARNGHVRRLRGRRLYGSGGNPNTVILSRNGIQTVHTIREVIEMTFEAAASVSA
jgi:hypothetical protein